MGTVYRFRVNLTGWIGAPGINTWHMVNVGEVGGLDTLQLQAVASDIMSVYSTLKGNLVSGMLCEVDPVVEHFDIATGDLQGVQGITSPAGVTGTGSGGQLPRSSALCVRLQTDAIRGNRMVQGRHFIGPVAPIAIAADGQIGAGSRTQVQTAYGGVLDVAGVRLVVWAQANPEHPRPDAREGRIGYVQSVLCNSVPGTLRSRKV